MVVEAGELPEVGGAVGGAVGGTVGGTPGGTIGLTVTLVVLGRPVAALDDAEGVLGEGDGDDGVVATVDSLAPVGPPTGVVPLGRFTAQTVPASSRAAAAAAAGGSHRRARSEVSPCAPVGMPAS